MRQPFADELVVKARAKHKVETNQLHRWWTNKYDLPTTSAEFQSQAPADILAERYEDLFLERSQIQEKLKTMAQGVDRTPSLQYLRWLDHVLDGEPLRDLIEDALRRGQQPDFLKLRQQMVKSTQTRDRK